MADGLDPDRLLSLKQVAAIVGFNLKTLRRWLAEGKMPPANFIAGNDRRWKRSIIMLWIDMGRPVWPTPNAPEEHKPPRKGGL